MVLNENNTKAMHDSAQLSYRGYTSKKNISLLINHLVHVQTSTYHTKIR